jgi:hypothetical protein
LQQRTGRGRFDGRDVIASNKSVRVCINRNVGRYRHPRGSARLRFTENARTLARPSRDSPVFSRVVYAPMLMDMSSASVLVSRTRLSSALWCASVLRIDITDQPKAAICARTRGKSVEVSQSHCHILILLLSRFVRLRRRGLHERRRRRVNTT